MKDLDLLKKCNELLEITKCDSEKYEKERKLLFEITKNNNAEFELSFSIVNSIAAIVNLDKFLNIKEKDCGYLKDLSIILKEQKTRNSDKNNNVLFEITDKLNNSHLFLTRKNAEKYIKENKTLFDNSTINIVDNKIYELEFLLNIIVRNF